MSDLWKKLQNTKKPIFLYGIGNGADKIYNELLHLGVKISGVFSTAEFVRDKVVYGFKLCDYEDVKKRFKEFIVLVCFGSNRPEVLNEIKRISSEQELYFPDVPVYESPIFNLEYAQSNKKKLEWVYSLLNDEKSKETFRNTVLYKLSGECEYLYEIEESESEPFESFFILSSNEVYLDLGAYNGDTVLDFKLRVNSFKKIIAVEPNLRSFKKLKENTADIDNIVYFNKYISDHTGTVEISSNKGRGTSAVKRGVSVECDTVDNLTENYKITILKADVEGEELKMLEGAQKTISKYSPKMQIAAYHKSDDLWTIPESVLKINPNYDIYMRHFPYLPAWDTIFYFIPKNKKNR